MRLNRRRLSCCSPDRCQLGFAKVVFWFICLSPFFVSPATAVQATLPTTGAMFARFARATQLHATQRNNYDTLVICPDAFRGALSRWVEFRTAQQHRVLVQPPARSAYAVRRQILEVAAHNDLKHIVLVGDSGDRKPARLQVPTDFVMARDNVKFGSELEIATDNRYADFDDDQIPDAAIGRIPVDSAAELNAFIDRVIQYEEHAKQSEAIRRINFIAGVGGFGKVVDGVIEETTKGIVTELMPGKIQTSMTYGSWTSPYCPDPRHFAESAIARFNEGCLFWVYIGHGNRHRLDNVYMPDARAYPILNEELIDQIDCRQGNPIALFLACYTCAHDDAEDCLAEKMLRRPNGPIAAIGGTRVTKPAAMGLLSLEMMHDYFHANTATLGEILLHSKQRMIRGSQNFRKFRDMIEGLAKAFSPNGTFRIEKQEHVHLFHLFGDPLLRLPRPQEVIFAGPAEATAGQTIQVSGKSPVSGTLRLELAYQRDRLKERFKRRRRFDPSSNSLAEYQAVYDSARQLVCSSVEIKTNRGFFSTKLTIPQDISGPCVIRAVVNSTEGVAIGSAAIEISESEVD